MGRLHHRKSMGQLWDAPAPQGCNLPRLRYGLKSLPALQMLQISHFCEIHSLSYEASKFLAMLSLCFFLTAISPLGRTSYPRSLIKVIAHHSRLGRTFWHLIHGSVAKTAGGVARRSLVRANSNYNTRMYISRRKCEMVLAVAKLGAGQILVTSMFASIFLAWLASCYHVANMISMLLAWFYHVASIISMLLAWLACSSMILACR